MQFSQFWPELPFPVSSIQSAFGNLHERNTGLYSTCSITATRRKLTGEFWLKILLNHFAILIVLALVLEFMAAGFELATIVQSVLPASVLVFVCLYFTKYWPVYQLEFIPHLEACVENYRQQQLGGIQQCKKQQYTVLSLRLIQYVFQELSGITQRPLNTIGVQSLVRQYGVSVKSILPVLKLIYRADWNRKSIRKRIEITDDFETAREYFRHLDEPRGIAQLEKLQ